MHTTWQILCSESKGRASTARWSISPWPIGGLQDSLAARRNPILTGARNMTARSFHADGSAPPVGPGHPIFVFGSNIPGWHGKGAARLALERYGAERGVGEGLRGQSYGIPTKRKNRKIHFMDPSLASLPLESIAIYVSRFLAVAHSRPDLQFVVTRIGCVLAGYDDADIAPLFREAPFNCSFAEAWAPYIDSDAEAERTESAGQVDHD